MKRLFVPIALLFVAILYQNCSEVTLEDNQIASKALINIKNPEGHICPGKSPATGQKVKFLFLIDMSLSNIGEIDRSSGFIRLNTENAVDLEGVRFQAVKSFINNCGEGENASYSVIGFSDTAMFGTSSQGSIRDCNSAFTSDKSLAKSFVNDLKSIQNEDINAQPTEYGSPFQMGMTSYREALKCSDTNIKVDLSLNYNSTAFYQIFFITDGKPNESFTDFEAFCDGDIECEQTFAHCEAYPSDSNEFRTCMELAFNEEYYASQIESLSQRLKINNTSFSFLPVYYGEEEDYETAKEALDNMAQVVDPESETVRVENISDISDTLCGSLEPQTETPYMTSEPYVINLTAKEVNGSWYADSDMDGMIDVDEVAHELDPQIARTNGYLDSICTDYYDGNCPSVGSSCQESSISPFLNECEKDLIPNTNLNGLDSDEDGLIDYIEIIKGTHPSISDDSQQNFDGDEKTNHREVVIGTNPKKVSPFKLIERYIELSLSPMNENFCDQGLNGLSFVLSNFPYVEEVLAYNDPKSGSWNLSHEEGENVYLVYYIAEPISLDPSLKKRVYAALIRLKNNTTNEVVLTQNHFQLLGELQ